MRKSLKADSHAWAPRIPKHPWRQERNKISVHYESTEVKQTVAARPKGGADERFFSMSSFMEDPLGIVQKPRDRKIRKKSDWPHTPPFGRAAAVCLIFVFS